MAYRNPRISITAVGGKQVQANWNETDPNSPAYIANKPDISGALTRQVVEQLPTENIDPNCIYMVPVDDHYDEYMYINGNWEQIGSTQVEQVQSDWTETDPTSPAFIDNKPSLATVATSGDYTDLSNTPSLATVATSGDYDDLTNKPTIPAAQVNSDWNASTGVAEILNKPSLATVATSGAYSDLTGTPTLATVATTGDYDDLTNAPAIPVVNDATITIEQNGTTVGSFTTNDATNQTINLTGGSNDWFGTQAEFDALQSYDEDTNYHIEQELATVAFTGDYDDLTNKPTVTQVQADWTQSDNTAPDYIKQKPPIPQTTVTENSATPVLNVSDSQIVNCTAALTSLTINSVEGGQYESNIYFTTGNAPFTMTVPNTLSGIVGSTSLQANTDYIVCIKDNRMVISYNGYTGGVSVNNNAPTLAYGQTSTVGTVDGTNLTVTMPAAPSVPTTTSQLTNDGDGNGTAYVLDTSLATVATTGDYSDLLNTPSDLVFGSLFGSPASYTIEYISQSDYNNLQTYDNHTIYLIY